MSLSPASLREVSRLYANQSLSRRAFVWARWQLCPFEDLAALLPERGKILELGCGIGLFSNTAALQSSMRELHGIDDAGPAIEIAKATTNGRTAVSFDRRDAREFSRDGEFDAVSMIDIIHHVPRAQQANVLKMAWRCLKPGGLLLFKDIDERPRWMVWACYLHDQIQNHPPTFLKNVELKNLLESNGFDIFDERRQHSLYVPHITYLARKK